MDRDVVAAMNIGRKGAEVFQRSQGAANEAMIQESVSKEPVILKVDASKLSH
jgi:transposase